MKKAVKKTAVAASAALVILSSCATKPANEKPATQEAEPEKKIEKAQEKKAEKPKPYTKVDFMEDLQNTLNKEDVEAALSLYETKLPPQFKDDFDIVYLKASLYISISKFDEAQEICNQLLEKDPDNQEVIALAAAIAKARGDKAERAKQIKSLLEKDKSNPAANIELGEDAFNRKNYKQALTYYKIALTREPHNVDALWGAGQTDYFLERDEESKQYFNKIIELDPTNADAYNYLGKIAYAANEYKVASDYAKKALSINSESYEYNMDYGMYERYLGHTQNALDSWTKAISLQPDYFLAYAYRAGLYDEEDRFKEALADYETVLKLNPKYFYAYESIGILALHEEKWAQARQSFMKCYEFNKENISYPLMITYCYYMEGNSVEAKKFSNDVLRKMQKKESIEYTMLRLYHDMQGERNVPQKIAGIQNRNLKGKMYYYMGLYTELATKNRGTELANGYYTKVVEMNSPMFFEFRLAEWRLK